MSEKSKAGRVLPDRAVALDLYMIWQRAVFNALRRAHDGLREAVALGGCAACPYRDNVQSTGGCRGGKCPVNRVFDCVNRELKRIGRMKVSDMDMEVKGVADI